MRVGLEESRQELVPLLGALVGQHLQQHTPLRERVAQTSVTKVESMVADNLR